MAHDPEQLAIDSVKIILKGWHFAAHLAFAVARGAARTPVLPLFSFPCWMKLVFLSGAHSTEGLGKGTKPEEQTSHFFHFLKVALSKGYLERNLQPLAEVGAVFPLCGHPWILASATALRQGSQGLWTPPSLLCPWCQHASPTQPIPSSMFHVLLDNSRSLAWGKASR